TPTTAQTGDEVQDECPMSGLGWSGRVLYRSGSSLLSVHAVWRRGERPMHRGHRARQRKHVTGRALLVVALAVVIAPLMAWTPAVLAAPTTVLQDTLESGSFSGWTSVTAGTGGSATVQQSVVANGANAARFTSTSASTS